MSLLNEVRAALPEYVWQLVCEIALAEHGSATVEVVDLRTSSDGDDLRELHDRVWPEFATVRNETLARLTGVPIAPPARVVP